MYERNEKIKKSRSLNALCGSCDQRISFDDDDDDDDGNEPQISRDEIITKKKTIDRIFFFKH